MVAGIIIASWENEVGGWWCQVKIPSIESSVVDCKYDSVKIVMRRLMRRGGMLSRSAWGVESVGCVDVVT